MSRVPRAPLVLVLAAATAIRLVSWLEIRDGPLLYLHRWTKSDMAFFDEWAQAIVGGDVLGGVTPRPYHSGHNGVAREAYRLSGAGGPFDEAAGDSGTAGSAGTRSTRSRSIPTSWRRSTASRAGASGR